MDMSSCLPLLLFSAMLLTTCHGFWFSSLQSTELVSFHLHTRNKTDGEVITSNRDSIQKSTFNPNLPTKIFLHGWFNSKHTSYITSLRKAMLKQLDCNFIEADWSLGSLNPNYVQAKRLAQQAGSKTADFLIWLKQEFGLNYNDVHVLGHSLGGQAAGALGKTIGGQKIGRISGLDPAQMGFDLNDPDDTLGPEDAKFVDVMHTSFLASKAMGHVDFFPNGGSVGIYMLSWISNHLKAVYMYTSSINSGCQFTAYKCRSYSDLVSKSCSTNCENATSCNRMGYYASPQGAKGSLYLKVSSYDPYC